MGCRTARSVLFGLWNCNKCYISNVPDDPYPKSYQSISNLIKEHFAAVVIYYKWEWCFLLVQSSQPNTIKFMLTGIFSMSGAYQNIENKLGTLLHLTINNLHQKTYQVWALQILYTVVLPLLSS